jgi:hypothetical protein
VIVGKKVKFIPFKNCPIHLITEGTISGYIEFDEYFLVKVIFGADVKSQCVDPDNLEYVD